VVGESKQLENVHLLKLVLGPEAKLRAQKYTTFFWFQVPTNLLLMNKATGCTRKIKHVSNKLLVCSDDGVPLLPFTS
jgi:hypothetical protein